MKEMTPKPHRSRQMPSHHQAATLCLSKITRIRVEKGDLHHQWHQAVEREIPCHYGAAVTK